VFCIISPDSASQRAAASEVSRVLKPNGCFIIHETNPRNPLFRFYMGMCFLLKSIDEGTERWISPLELAGKQRASVVPASLLHVSSRFVPRFLLRPFAIERRLEQSRLKFFSVHYMAVLRKDAAKQPVDLEVALSSAR
jgi:hypothetical protein